MITSQRIINFRMKALPLFFFAAMWLVSPSVQADEQQKAPRTTQGRMFSPQQFKRAQEDFITREAGITPLEATQFFPLFQELKSQQRALNKQRRECTRRSRAVGLTEEEAESLLGKLDELNQKKLKLESDFHQKSRKIIGARKMLKVISAERRFDRQILHKMMDRKK